MNTAFTTSGATFRLKKEIRPLLMPAFATILITYVPFLVSSNVNESRMAVGIALMAYFVGCIFMAAASFGHEFEGNTHALLLSQPHSRRRMWWEKMRAFAAMIAITWIGLIPLKHTLGDDQLSFLLWCLGLPWLAVSLAPYFTLISRSFVAGAVFAGSAPLLALMIIHLIIEWYRPGWIDLPTNEFWVNVGSFGFVVIPGLIIFRLGYLQFQNLAVVGKNMDLQSLEIGILGYWFRRVSRTTKPIAMSRISLWRLLFRKELRLHSFSLVMAGLLIVFAGMFAAGRFAGWAVNDAIFFGSILIYAAVFPFLTGAAAIAEERALGTHDWHRTLPCSAFKQFSMKAGVTFGLALVLGAGLPVILMWICSTGLHLLEIGEGSNIWGGLLIAGFASVQVTGLSLFASAVRPSTIRAATLAIVMAIVIGSLAPMLGVFADQPAAYDVSPVVDVFGNLLETLGVHSAFRTEVGILVVLVSFRVILGITYHFYLRPAGRRSLTWASMAVVCTGTAFACLAAVMIFRMTQVR